MTQLTTIDIEKEYLHFSSAHFTIFSAQERERLHGHNFFVSVSVTAEVQDDGMCFNYNELKRTLRKQCEALDEYVLLPERSAHLSIVENPNYYKVDFAEDTMFFLKKDTLLLPIINVTIEELSRYFLEELRKDSRYGDNDAIQKIVLRVSSGPGQWGSASWEKG
ncbi:MAG: 6-pyruvoyl trahydropterin synthase family protein [Cellvibrionaceae bacterium]